MSRTALPFVVISSPFGSDVEGDTEYARLAVADSLRRGEAPFAPHLLYPAAIGLSRADRQLGMQAALTVVRKANIFALYVDRGIGVGMRQQLELARGLGISIERRSLAEVAPAEPEDDAPQPRRNSVDLG